MTPRALPPLAGKITPEICQLTNLQVLQLSDNNLQGARGLPKRAGADAN